MTVDVIRGELVLPATEHFDRPRLAVAAFLAGYRGRTFEAYELDLRQWLAFCEDHGLGVFDVKRHHIELYARILEEMGRMPSTVARRLSSISSFYAYCVDEEHIDRNPASRVRRPKQSMESPRKGLDRAELMAFLSAAHAMGPLADALACLLALNGLRVSEACNANLETLSTERGHHTLMILGKGGQVAKIPLAPRTVAAVALAVGTRTSGPLLERDGVRLNRAQAARLVARIGRAAHIDHRVVPHDCRHSFVTNAFESGAVLRDVQAGARHADPRTTLRYDRNRVNLDRHVTYRLASYVA